MNGYIGFYKGKQYEVHAGTSYQAQQKLCNQIQAKTRRKVKDYDISITLAEKDGEQITHSTTMI